MKKIIGALVLGIIAASAYAITVNPASNVTADSAATALTIPYRDVNGDIAVNNLTVAAVSSSAGVSVSTAAVGATAFKLDGAYSTVQLRLKTPTAVGQLVFNTTLGNVCVSTGTATAEAYLLVGTASTKCE